LQQLLEGGGYSDAEKQAITEKAAEALAAQKGSSQAQLANHLASSGNAAGYSGAMSSLDNSAAQTASDQARQNTIDFANEGERRKELAAAGLTSLLGINTAAQLGTSGQASGLASLGGGVDTSNQGASSFDNQNFQATPDASANPNKPGTGTPGTGGGGTPGKAGTPGPTPGTKWGDNGTLYDVNGNVINPKTGAMVGPNGEDIPGTAGGHQPPEGSPGIYPGTTWGPHGTLYGPNGEVIDPSTGEPVPSGEVLPEPTDPGIEPPPDIVPGDPGGQVLPDPTGGDPGDPGIEPGTEGGGDVWAGPGPTAYSTASNPAAYFSGNPNGATVTNPDYITVLRRLLSM
jgi:hypothetical protein